MKSLFLKNQRRERRSLSVRSKLRRRSSAPRLCVSRSLKHISAQIVDDETGRTLAHATSTAKALTGELTGKNKTQRAAVIGAEIARKAKEAGIEKVVFDRGGFLYHGRIAAAADAAREAGLEF